MDERKLRIALISTAFFGVPPKQYGGLEQVVFDLFCGLIKLGHKVVLFAPKGSIIPKNGFVYETGEPLNSVNVDWVKAEEDASKIYLPYLNELDIAHGHNWFGFEYQAKINNPKTKVCHTHHGHLDPNWWLQNKPPFKLNFIAISKWMKANYKAMGMESEYAYNGIEIGKYPFEANKGDRLLYVGRFDKFKQPHIAIEIAKKLGMGLDLVGGTFVQDKAYLDQIRNSCDGKQIAFYPDVSQEIKVEFMQKAKCLLFPSAMGEPFGLVSLECLSCGTPTIALRDGAIPEIVLNGKVGFVCDNIDEMIGAVGKIHNINPLDCRQWAENFSREKMAMKYVELYERILSGDEW